MTNGNNGKRVITISVIAILVITGVILFLSLSDFQDEPGNVKKTSNNAATSDSLPGENNKEVKTMLKPQDIEGTYAENTDGWTYSLTYAPSKEYDGIFTGGFDHSHDAVADNHEKYYTEQGTWKLENGEVKLYIDSVYSKSLWACGDYMVDSRNYFVGDVPQNKDEFQAAFTCKARESGDTQILNFYSDGKMIMEIIKDDGLADSSAQAQEDAQVPSYQVAVGTYTIEDNLIYTQMIGSSEKILYIVDDGIANWVYNKVQQKID